MIAVVRLAVLTLKAPPARHQLTCPSEAGLRKQPPLTLSTVP